jgi:hypothetical protein
MTARTLNNRLKALEKSAGLGPVKRTRIEVWFKGDDGLWRTSVPLDLADGSEGEEHQESGLTDAELNALPISQDVFRRYSIEFV